MINYKKKCIFIEVPKTGSTSIRNIIGFPSKPHLDVNEVKKKLIKTSFDDVVRINLGDNILSKTITKLTPKWIKKKYGIRLFNSFYKFGFVRNPWSRVVSLYLRNEGIQKKNEMTFGEFVSWIENSSDTSIHPSPKKNQLDWFIDENGNVLVDYIGKFETLDKDWQNISSQMSMVDELPHENKNSKVNKHYTEYYNEYTKEIIREKFKIDIEYFKYDFEN